MDGAPHNNSFLLPIFISVILFGFVERPVVVGVIPFVELTLWMRRASLSCAPTADVPFFSVQVG